MDQNSDLMIFFSPDEARRLGVLADQRVIQINEMLKKYRGTMRADTLENYIAELKQLKSIRCTINSAINRAKAHEAFS